MYRRVRVEQQEPDSDAVVTPVAGGHVHHWKLPPDRPTCRGRCETCGLTKHSGRGTYKCPKCRLVTHEPVVSIQLSPRRWRHRCRVCWEKEVQGAHESAAAD